MSLVHINSKHRIPGTSFFNFTVAVDSPKPDFCTATLSDFVMPQTAPNIIAPNNVFYYTEASVNKSVTFPEGQYDLCSFVAMYTLLMTANSSLTASGTVIYATETVDYQAWVGFTAPADTLSSSFAIRWSLMSDLAYLLGFQPVDTVSGRNTIWSTFSYNFSPDNFVYLHLNGFPQCTGTLTNTIPCTFPISLYSNGGVVSKFDQRISIPAGHNLFRDKTLSIKLFRDNGKPLKISSDWGFTLILS